MLTGKSYPWKMGEMEFNGNEGRKNMTEVQKGCMVYLDNGGTFTDAIAVWSDGAFETGKALTTPDDLERCFFGSIERISEKKGTSLKNILSTAHIVGYGTTLGTNIMVSGGVGGPKIGFITTKGVEDRTIIMRHRAAGLTRSEAMHMISAEQAPPLIPRKLIRGVAERVDGRGEVIIPLNEGETKQAINELLDEGVEGIAVGMLWSLLNPVHEIRVREIIQEMAPGLPVAISSDVAPTFREFPRFMSTIVDLLIGKPLRSLLSVISHKLKDLGYLRPLLIMQAFGGLSQAAIVKPATTLHSGPVGGLMGIEFFKKIYGYENAIGSDVGGTSFDVCVSPEKGSPLLREPLVGRYEISNPMREIITIGAGGGSIARVNPVTKVLSVGPDSAGANPGPVCYNFGGIKPTVTDANVVMNRIDPDYFLGGKIKLDKEKAVKAIEEKIARPLGVSTENAAEAICKVVDGMMQAVLRTRMGLMGIDPKEFVLFAYGGCGPTHCAGYSSGLRLKKVIIPSCASVFCAFGASTADITHRYEKSPWLTIQPVPYSQKTMRYDFRGTGSLEQLTNQEGVQRFNKMFAELEERAFTEMAEEGVGRDMVHLSYEVFARYGGQLWEIRTKIPHCRISTVDELKSLIRSFEDTYEREYGLGAMAPKGGVEIITIAVEASASTRKPQFSKGKYVGSDASPAVKGSREVYFDGKWVNTKIYEMSRFEVGNVVEGPAIIEATDTTLVIPRHFRITVDEYFNMVMESI
jgi:N-methylhydantoinase A